MSFIGKGIVICLLILAVSAVSAWMTESLKLPMLEVGEIWVSSVQKVQLKIFNFMSTFVDIYSYKFYILLILGSVIGYCLYNLLFTPLNRVRILGDIGYLPDGKFTLKEISNSVKKRRVIGEVPPVYPNGWFGLMEGFKLKRGESTSISVLGLNLAVFRDENSNAYVLDAYCPHMGANIGIGGHVIGDCLECPFHGWQFRGSDGKVTKIPYSESIPDMAKVKSWPSLEINGWIYIWHHAEGVEPTWLPPEIEGIKSGNWTYGGRTEHYINAHIEEIPENGADLAHLYHVHRPIIFAGIDLTTMWSKYFSFACHEWQGSWAQNPAPEEHIGCLSLTQRMNIFGKTFFPLNLSVKARQIGPGIVYLNFDSFFGKGIFIEILTPVEPMVQRLSHNIYMHWAVPMFIKKFYMNALAIQSERDIMIWNNKKYAGKPLFAKSKEDSLIARHRRWYSQFYSEHSPRLRFQKDTLDW